MKRANLAPVDAQWAEAPVAALNEEPHGLSPSRLDRGGQLRRALRAGRRHLARFTEEQRALSPFRQTASPLPHLGAVAQFA